MITIGVFLCNNFIQQKFDNIQYKTNINIAKDKASLKSEKIDVTEDIKVYRNDFKIYKDSVVDYNYDFSGITINITFLANHFYESKVSNFKIEPQSGHTIVNFINKDIGKIFYKKDSQIKNIIIYVKPQFLKEFLQNDENLKSFIDNLQNQTSSKTIKTKKTDAKTQLCALQIYDGVCKDNLDILFIQSKVLEILSYEFKDMINKSKDNTKNIKFSSYDMDALYKAKDILCENFKTTPSIKELSKIVKLNEFKLKYGFKIFFETSPHAFVLENKMYKAKKLLINTDLNISEVAKELGYKQTHNFTTAFIKYFGIKPKELIKSRKHYY